MCTKEIVVFVHHEPSLRRNISQQKKNDWLNKTVVDGNILSLILYFFDDESHQ